MDWWTGGLVDWWTGGRVDGWTDGKICGSAAILLTQRGHGGAQQQDEPDQAIVGKSRIGAARHNKNTSSL
jgi:hypothetical protein